MNELLAEIGWSKVFFAEKVGIPERTVRDWCKTGRGRGYTIGMAYLELVKRIVG